MTMAKGLTCAYVPLGAVGMRRGIADHFKDKVFYGGLTYNSHPLGCAAALATIQVYEDDRLIERARTMGVVMKQLHWPSWPRKHPSVGAVRNIGLFGIVELVRDRDDHGADGALQRHLARRWRRSGKLLPRRTGSTPSCAGTPSSPTRR